MTSDNSLQNEKVDNHVHKITSVISQEMGITTFVSPNTGKAVHITGDLDEAAAFAANIDKSFVITPEEDRKLLWKIDMYLLPLICILYCVQFMDKTTISYASILGLRTDLHMHGDQYSWASSAFYFGYLFYEFFASYTLQRFNLSKMMAIYVILWGMILCLHSVPQYAGFVVLRVILGALESAITPAFTIITAQWYKREEVLLRTSIWFACNGAGTILGGGAIAYNVYNNENSYSIAAWKLIFIITGVITIGLGIALFFHIPSKPTDAWFLTEREKQMVVERIRQNQQGFGNKHFKREQFIEAISDRRTWIFFFIGIASSIPNGGLTNFGSILLSDKLGYSTGKTLLMSMPGGAVELVGLILMGYLYKFVKVRLFWATVNYCITIMATCFLAFANNKKLEYAGYTLTSVMAFGMVCLLSLIASNVIGHTKKITTNAIYLIGYCVGNIIGPQTFVDKQAPKYTGAVVAMVACNCVVTALLVVLWIDYYLDNKRRDANMESELVKEFMAIENHEFADLTDKQNPLFRYTL